MPGGLAAAVLRRRGRRAVRPVRHLPWPAGTPIELLGADRAAGAEEEEKAPPRQPPAQQEGGRAATGGGAHRSARAGARVRRGAAPHRRAAGFSRRLISRGALALNEGRRSAAP